MRRSDLFGYVGTTPTLEAEMDYGFTPGGSVLDAEEDFGAGTPDDDILESEESYVDDIDEFGADEDDEDDFDLDMFGGDDNDPDAQLDALDAALDGEAFGESPLSVAPGLEQYRAPLAGILFDGVKEGLVGADGIDRKIFDLASSAGYQLDKVFTPGDMEEIAQALLADPGFGQWNGLSDEERAAMVNRAVAYAAVPGLELGWNDAFAEAWNQGQLPASFPKTVFAAFKTYFTQDIPKVMYAALAEIPAIGATMQAMGWDPANADQLFNARAVLLYALSFVKSVDASLANAITARAQNIISAVGATSQAGGGTVEEALVEQISLPEPAQQVPDSGTWLPEPPQILAIGYAVGIGGAVLGFFR